MLAMSVTLAVSKFRGWLNDTASNMLAMSVTLEVSKLRGWLNDTAPWRESKGGHAARGEEGRQARERRRAIAVDTQRVGQGSTIDMGQGEEHTWNMLLMSVTLEVSHLEMSALKARML